MQYSFVGHSSAVQTSVVPYIGLFELDSNINFITHTYSVTNLTTIGRFFPNYPSVFIFVFSPSVFSYPLVYSVYRKIGTLEPSQLFTVNLYELSYTVTKSSSIIENVYVSSIAGKIYTFVEYKTLLQLPVLNDNLVFFSTVNGVIEFSATYYRNTTKFKYPAINMNVPVEIKTCEQLDAQAIR